MKKYKNSEGKLNTRSAILQWWRSLTILEQLDLCEIHKEMLFDRLPSSLTGKEIQNIYEKENN